MTFVPIKYLIDQSYGSGNGPSRKVKGYAFQVPGWPNFHVCVRRGSRYFNDMNSDPWVVDHYETGLSVTSAGTFEKKEDAPAAMKKLLDSKGKTAVRKALRKRGIPV